jgi:hypothetical protein
MKMAKPMKMHLPLSAALATPIPTRKKEMMKPPAMLGFAILKVQLCRAGLSVMLIHNTGAGDSKRKTEWRAPAGFE